MKHDQWLDLVDRKTGQQAQGRVRLMLQWVYSKVKYLQEYLKKWDETLEADAKDKEAIESFINQLESPFGFFEALQTEYFESEENKGD